MKKILSSYFGFNKQQRNGLYVLCFISIIFFVLRLSLDYFIKPDDVIIEDVEQYENLVDSAIQKKYKRKSYSRGGEKLFVFDPNTVTKEELIKLGFWEKTAETFIKFRSRGFVFRKKEDLKKVYGISENFYKKLESYIVIKDVSKASGIFSKSEDKSDNRQKLEINQADSISIIALKGVGPSYAKRIMKYRTMLGGFTTMEQLMEVYGMTSELYELLCKQCIVNNELVQKINLNTADFRVINKHPYISYELTKLIVQTRQKNRLNTAVFSELVQDDELVKKLLPYVEF